MALLFLLNIFFAIPVLADENEDITAYDRIVQDKMANQEEPKSETESQSFQLVQDDLIKKLNNPDDVKNTLANDTIYEREPNNTISAADQIYLNYYVTGTNSSWYDIDYYKLTITQSGTLLIVGVAGAYDKYMAIGLEDRNGNNLEYSWTYTSQDGTTGQVLESYVSPGTYYIVVFGMPLYMGSSYYPLVGERYMFLTSMSASGGGGGGTVSDTTPPTVSSTDPQKSATNVPIDKTFVFTYNEPIKIINGSKIYFFNCDTYVRTYTQSRVEGNKLYITPNTNFLAYTKYMVNVNSGGVTDLSDNAPSDYYWSFTTGGNAASSVLVISVSLDKTSTSITKGNTETLIASINPANATNKALSWSSSNPSVATVNNSGVVSAVSTGSATITVTTTDGGKTANCYVTVTEPVTAVTSVSLNKNNTTIVKGNNETLIATIYPANATNRTISWISSNPSVATVNANGIVSAVSTGMATITAISADGGKVATCKVSVTSNGNYKDWTDQVNVPPDKFWTIKFNLDVGATSVNDNNVYVSQDFDGNNKILGTEAKICPTNPKWLLLYPPQGGWKAGESYYLFISKDLKSGSGKSLGSPVRMKFVIASDKGGATVSEVPFSER
ncbi:MAG: Ig-like domain-containing protein [Fermentimonas sp.]|nr:Ig-like domain-containing protein [Fermentimonas sp.]